MKYSPIIAWCALAHADAECDYSKYSLEILRVQDASGDFYEYVDSLTPNTDKLVNKLTTNFGEFKYGLSSFLDKPVPTRGMGYYGNYAALNMPPDYCFMSHGSMSSDAEAIRDGLGKLSGARGWGGDIPENPYEALIFGAYSDSVGWSSPQSTHTSSGRRIGRFALVVTDAIPHEAGDVYNGVTLAWNAGRTYANPDRSSGGFGSRTWGELPNIITHTNDEDHNDYIEMSDLFRTGDLGGALTAQEQARLDALITKFGPFPWPAIENHPGDASKNCSVTEYPSLEQVAAAMKKFKITPIFLLKEPTLGWGSEAGKKCGGLGLPTDLECLKEIYTQELAAMGIDFVVATVTADSDADVIVETLRAGVEQLCNLPTEPPVDPSTQSTLSTTVSTTAGTTPATTTPCNEDLRINWFHLQEDEIQWKNRMPLMLKEWKRVADTVDARFPNSKFGAASFLDTGNHYKIQANFSDKDTTEKTLNDGYLGTYPTTSEPTAWPELESSELLQFKYDELNSEPEAPLEPVVWTALHLNWDQGPNVVKIITINQQAPAHFSLDGSKQAARREGLPPFDKDTYPSTEPSIWPSTSKPQTSLETDYTTLEYVRDVLAEHDIHLIVNYGATAVYSSRDTWKYVMSHLGLDSEKNLHFLPGTISMYDNVLKSMELATRCDWSAVPCHKDLKINWFHLQEDEIQWKNRMPLMLKEWKRVADTVDARFPNSKFGAASFLDTGNHYKIQANFSDKDTTEKTLNDGYLGKYPTTSEPIAWPELETSALLQFKYDELNSEPEAPLEPVVWTALHLNWDQGPNVVKIITINQQAPAHFSLDGSEQAARREGLPPFDKDTYPNTEPSIWPSTSKPQTSLETDYTTLEYVRDVLAEHDIHLIVNYGATAVYSSRDTWKYVMSHLGLDSEKNLHFLPGTISMYDNVLKSMKLATSCPW